MALGIITKNILLMRAREDSGGRALSALYDKFTAPLNQATGHQKAGDAPPTV